MEVKRFLRANWDRVAAVVLVLAGLTALSVGWLGISGTGLAAEQNPYLISGGLGGIALVGIGCTLWLSADLQDEWRRLDGLEDRLAALEKALRGDGAQAAANGAARRRPARAAARR